MTTDAEKALVLYRMENAHEKLAAEKIYLITNIIKIRLVVHIMPYLLRQEPFWR